MNEMKTTLFFCLAAIVLAGAAVIIDPSSSTPEVFTDQGEAFFPKFTDPQAPRSIEVIDYDEETATARPIKVEFHDNQWVIPSHNNYPADAGERLANTAAALIEIKKDIIISQNAEDHGEYGVIDPLDQENASLAGRGQRVTLRDAEGETLADFVIGKKVPDKPSFRYLRVPGQRRVYAVETTADVSAKFEDWIETDLLKIVPADIRKIDINRYSINEQMGRLDNVERTILTKSDAKWKIQGGGEPNSAVTNDLTSALDNLKIVDVQPKPPNLTADLKTPEGIQLSMDKVMSLREKGFFVTQMGQLLSNEGEIVFETANGLQYTLRFGEIAGGGGQAAAQPAEGEEAAAEEEGERRYVFITVNYSEARAKQYAGEGKEPDAKGKELGGELRDRFAEWYYVISGADFDKLRPTRRDLSKG